MVAVQEAWGENPPTVKALTLRMGHLKKLAREYDSENPSFAPSGRGRKAGGTVKKEEGYVTPASSPKQTVRTPKKGAAKKRAAEGKTAVTPRRMRRKVTSAKYVVEDTEGESDAEMKVEQDSDEEEGWKPAMVEEVDCAAEEEEIEEEEVTAEEAQGDEMEADGEVNGEAEDEEDRVTDEIKDVSSALQEKLTEANPGLFLSWSARWS